MARETWYVLEDGTAVDPSECSADEKGVLTHKSGAGVAMKLPDCPRSRSVDPDEERAKAKPSRKDMKPDEEPKPRGYRTRESKVD